MSAARAIMLGGREFAEHDLVCPDCGSPMRLYWQPRDRPPWYTCTRWPECRGAHGARWDGAPMGTPADATTRAARRAAHRALDPLWENGRMSREAAYAWLAARMGLSRERAHISQFSAEQCYQVISICSALAVLLTQAARR